MGYHYLELSHWQLTSKHNCSKFPASNPIVRILNKNSLRVFRNLIHITTTRMLFSTRQSRQNCSSAVSPHSRETSSAPPLKLRKSATRTSLLPDLPSGKEYCLPPRPSLRFLPPKDPSPGVDGRSESSSFSISRLLSEVA